VVGTHLAPPLPLRQIEVRMGRVGWSRRQAGFRPSSPSVSRKVVPTRPLCPDPQVARYTGSGSLHEARELRLQDAVSGKANRGDAQA
jgi:hypothetical protein